MFALEEFKINLTPLVIADIINRNGNFPNNESLPLIIYKNVIHFENVTAKEIQKFLHKNKWINSWVDGIYNYHHYHSNTHEALIVYDGHCRVEIGGDKGNQYEIEKGDVIIFPAGVSHKNLTSTKDFKTIGSYPIDVDYDMNYGKAEEHPKVDENIKQVPLPNTDPIFGEDGLLFQYWK